MMLGIVVVTGEYIMTIAGSGVTGQQSSTFDQNGSGAIDTNVDATTALLANPAGVAFGKNGTTIYIADTSNNAVRKVNNNRIITTIAGNGTNGYTGDNLAATSATQSYPYGIAVDSSSPVGTTSLL